MAEHRIRFLSFLGIAKDDRFCGYILENGENSYRFHGFKMEPNTDRLCLVLHNACQARYKRVMQMQAVRDSANKQVSIPHYAHMEHHVIFTWCACFLLADSWWSGQEEQSKLGPVWEAGQFEEEPDLFSPLLPFLLSNSSLRHDNFLHREVSCPKGGKVLCGSVSWESFSQQDVWSGHCQTSCPGNH